jgi:acyl carrier protein
MSPPRTVEAWEEALGGLVATLLEVPEVAADENMFELGADSVDAMRLTGLVRSRFGVELDVRVIFRAETVRGIARALAGPDAVPASATRPPLQRAVRPERIPLAFGQQGLWFLAQLWGHSPTYHLPVRVRVRGDIDRATMQSAWRDVVERHESLRTVFPEVGGEPFQVVQPVEATRPTLGGGPCVRADLDALVHDAAQQTFSITTEPAARAYLFTVEDQNDDHELLIVMHHIAADGWSVRPLISDLMRAYEARAAGSAPDWAPLPVQYADFALWQRRWLGDDGPSGALGQQLTFWRRTLDGLPARLALPTDRPAPASPSHRGAGVDVTIGADLRARMGELARSADGTMFMVLQSAFAALLTAGGAGTDVPIGTPVAGRDDVALQDLVGLFVNMVVLRTDTSGDPSFSDLLARVRTADLEAYAYQDAPFDKVVEALNPTRSSGQHPLFQVVMAYGGRTRGTVEAAGLHATADLVATAVAKFDLALYLDDEFDGAGQPSGISGTLEYATDMFEAQSATDLVTRWVDLLDRATREPGRLLSELI